MRFLLLPLLLMSTLHPAGAALFTEAERARIVAYWNKPGRYRVEARADAEKSGPWIVRLTPEASRWLHAYNRARGVGKVPPTQVPGATSPQTARWENWVVSKLAYDRWLAGQAADAANAQLGIKVATPATTPPVQPGLIPADLLAAVGNPPPFAAAVTPMRYTTTFDTGETITYTNHVGVNQRYAYYRFAQGVQQFGVALSRVPDAELDALFAESGMTPFEQHVAKAVSRLEGGFESVNTYDTGFLSVGFIQFATLEGGAGSLGEVLQRQKADRLTDFQNDFRQYGIDVSADGKIVVIDPGTGAELIGNEAVLKVIDDNRLVAVFQRAGTRSRPFRIAQVQVAKAHYYPANSPLKVTVKGQTLTGKVSDVIKSEAGMATLFDRKVNTGNISTLPDVVARVMEAHNLAKFEDVLPYEREIVQAMKYRVDFLQDKNLTQPK